MQSSISTSISNLTPAPVSLVYAMRDGLSDDEQKVLLFLADVSARASSQNIFNAMSKKGIPEGRARYALSLLVKIGLVDLDSSDYMITGEGAAVALVS